MSSAGFFSTMHRAEQHASRLPTKRMGKGSGGCRKANHVTWDVKRLDLILRVLAGGIAPPTNFNIHLAVILVCPCVVPSEHSENRGGLQLGRVSHNERIGSISQAAS